MCVRCFVCFVVAFCHVRHLGRLGRMGNTPTGCGSDLLTVLRTFTNDPKSKSVTNLFQRLGLDPNSRLCLSVVTGGALDFPSQINDFQWGTA